MRPISKESNKGFFIESTSAKANTLYQTKLLKMMREVFGVQLLPLGVIQLSIKRV
jgi:hypothetical protein